MSFRISVTRHENKSGYRTKMNGIQSISTNPQSNHFCQERVKSSADSICKVCFAQRYINMRASLRNCLQDNYECLKERVYTDTELLKLMSTPLSTLMVRIEAFGDVDNENQVLNYLHIIKLYPEIRFGVWTKNYRLWANAFSVEGKPDNCRLIVSSPIIGMELNIERFPYADSIFSVFPKETPDDFINCGARSCLTCKKCYFGNEKYIREKVK